MTKIDLVSIDGGLWRDVIANEMEQLGLKTAFLVSEKELKEYDDRIKQLSSPLFDVDSEYANLPAEELRKLAGLLQGSINSGMENNCGDDVVINSKIQNALLELAKIREDRVKEKDAR